MTPPHATLAPPPPPDAPPAAPTGRRAAALWLATLALLSVAVLAATAFTWRNAETFAAERLVRTAELYTVALEKGIRHAGPDALRRLDELVGDALGADLLGLALVDERGAVRAAAGTEPDAAADLGSAAWVQRAIRDRVLTTQETGAGFAVAVPTWIGCRPPRPRWGRFRRWRQHRDAPAGAREDRSAGREADPPAPPRGAPDEPLRPGEQIDSVTQGPEGPGRVWGPPGPMDAARCPEGRMAVVLYLDAKDARGAVRQAQLQAGFVVAVLLIAWTLAWRWRRTQLRAERLQGDERQADDRTARSLETVVSETTRLSNLVDALLRYARPRPPEPRPTDVGALAERVTALLAEEAGRQGVALVAQAPAVPVVCPCDPDQVEQVLWNLLRNAVQSQPDGGHATVRVAREGAAVVVRVEDAGPGVPPADRERIFAPFVTSRAEGSGLGLAIARQIAEAHGGTLRVTDAAAGGAAFVLTLPCPAGDAGGGAERGAG